jgi:hypothetical protein
MFRRRRKSPGPTGEATATADAVVAGVEEMLTGRLVLRRSGHDVNAWTCVNTLSHGSWETLSSIAAGRGRGDRAHAWDDALMFLAGELLSTARDPVGLERVQRGGLIPLELEMLGGKVPARPTPSRLAELVRARLAPTRGTPPGGASPPGPC